MNLLKESLFPMSTTTMKAKSKKIHQYPSKHSSPSNLENSFQTESLLSTSLNDSHHHNFELGVIDSDDDDTQHDQRESLGRSITRSRQKKLNSTSAAQAGGSIVIVEKPVHPNETLQAFAIRYRVPVSQLKRLNNLQNDQDFYALAFCRVPVRRFGILHETSSSTIVNLNEQYSVNSIPVTHLSQQNHHAFFNAMDQDLKSMRAKVEQLIETQPTSLIPQPVPTRMIVRSTTKSRSELNCDGADCGCKFWHIILTILLVALFVPFVYVYLYLISPEERLDHHPQ